MRRQYLLCPAAAIFDRSRKKQEQRQRIEKVPDEVRAHPVAEDDPIGAQPLIEGAERQRRGKSQRRPENR